MINTTYVPSLTYGIVRPRYNVIGDESWRTFTSLSKAQEREAELNQADELASMTDEVHGAHA